MRRRPVSVPSKESGLGGRRESKEGKGGGEESERGERRERGGGREGWKVVRETRWS